jgi:hypothetical protein
MAERLKVRFLTVIWGARYIDEFARVSLPSYLAPGNLPALAAGADLEVVVMTSRDSVAEFEGKPAFETLRRLCPVRFLFIDDLITTGCYGVTLTLAYVRGIAEAGEAQTDTTFVFMNSDFVLADGALATLLVRLREGARCVMAPSLRARAETALPRLMEAVDRHDLTLAMPARAMVRLAFDALHPTVIAKTVSQRFITCATHNQIYWQVDANTLLGRYHLIFMLAIRPEVPIGRVNSYCDYGLVPELVPSGQFTILDDSDDFFMLELQSAAQEKGFLHCGVKTPAAIARELSVWTTREHRRFAGVDVMFRTAGRPDGLDAARAALAAFMAEVQARMSRRPADHVDHIYWTLGVEAWRSLKEAGSDEPVWPPELEAADGPAGRGLIGWWQRLSRPGAARSRGRSEQPLWRVYTSLLARVRRAMGTMPNVPIWHHLRPDSRLLLGWVETLRQRQGARHLLIAASDSALPAFLDRWGMFDIRSGLGAFLEEAEAGLVQPGQAPDGGYDTALLHLHRADVTRTARLLEATRPLLRPGATIAVFIDHPNAEMDASNFSGELAQYIEDLLPADWIGSTVSARFAGGRIKRRLRRLERRVLNQLFPSSWTRLPLLAGAMLLWPVVAALTAANNLRMGRPSETCPAFCTSALILVSGADAPAADAVGAPHASAAPVLAAAEARD